MVNPNASQVRRYGISQKFFETIDTEAKAYWLGFILADGCMFGGDALL